MTAPVLLRPVRPAQGLGRWKATIVTRSPAGQLVDVEHVVEDLGDLDRLVADTAADITILGICIQPVEQGARQ